MAERPLVCVGAIALDGDRLLLVRRGQSLAAGRWSIPGGRVEPGETLAEAVVREVAEETGLEGPLTANRHNRLRGIRDALAE